MMRRVIDPRRVAGVRRVSTAYVRPNWLEEDCGNVPVHPQVQDSEVSEMLRGGHALQIASAKMLDAKVSLQNINTKIILTLTFIYLLISLFFYL